MIRRAWLCAAFALIAAPLSAKEAPWPAGIYGNVSMSGETGDLGGLEVRFYEQDGKHMAEYVLCEGWCNETTVAELSRDGERFVFDGVVQVFTDGKQVPETQHVRLKPTGRTFAAMVGTADDLWKVGTLKPLKEPFGLAVAKSEDEAAVDVPD